VVVGRRGRDVDQLFAVGLGHSAGSFAGRAMASLDHRLGLSRRVRHGRDVAAAAVHRNHGDGGAAGDRQVQCRKSYAIGPHVGDRFYRELRGNAFAALFSTFTPVLETALYNGMLDLSRHLIGYNLYEMFFRGIAAGFLIAAMVWLIPSAEAAQFFVIVLMTYLIATGGFVHIVAGSMSAFLLVFNGEASWLWALAQFTLPVLLGNIVGGTALFALIAYAQIMKEI